MICDQYFPIKNNLFEGPAHEVLHLIGEDNIIGQQEIIYLQGNWSLYGIYDQIICDKDHL